MVAVIAVFGIAALLWSFLLIRKAGLLGGCAATILMGSCIGYNFLKVDIGPAGLTSDRLFLALLFAMCGVHAWLGKTAAPRWNHRDGLLFGWVAILVANAVWVQTQTGDTTGLAKVAFFFVMPAMLYFVVRLSPLEDVSLRNLMTTFVFFAGYLSLVAIAERFGWYQIIVPRYIVTSDYVEFFGRARGPFLNPTANGLYMTVGICSLVLLWRHSGRSFQLLQVVLLFLMAAGLYATLTRSVWLGGALALIVASVSVLPRRLAVTFVGGAAIAGAALIITKWDSLKAFKRDRDVSVEAMQTSASLRPILAAVALNMFEDRPFTGVGMGRYVHHYEDYLADGSSAFPLEKAKGYVQHNIFLAILVEAGLVGLVPLLLLMVVWVRSGVELIRDTNQSPMVRATGVLLIATLLAFITNGIFHDLMIVQMVNHLVFLLAGLAVALSARADSTVSSRQTGFAPQKQWSNAVG